MLSTQKVFFPSKISFGLRVSSASAAALVAQVWAVADFGLSQNRIATSGYASGLGLKIMLRTVYGSTLGNPAGSLSTTHFEEYENCMTAPKRDADGTLTMARVFSRIIASAASMLKIIITIIANFFEIIIKKYG